MKGIITTSPLNTNFSIRLYNHSILQRPLIFFGGTDSCRLCSVFNRLIFGTLYPAYSSYKAVKSKDVREYVKWMMYWIIFALFTTAEVITDIFLCWLPFYYELKIAFVVWLLSPYTKGSSVLYRKFVHPTLSSKEKDIDEYLSQAKDKSYDTLVHFGRKGLNVAATAAVMAAAKGQGVLSDRLRSFSMQDLSSFQTEDEPKSTSSITTQPASGQHRTRAVMRNKSETGYSKESALYKLCIFPFIDTYLSCICQQYKGRVVFHTQCKTVERCSLSDIWYFREEMRDSLFSVF
uniref:Receptor expression-enhancing protein n=1 Tax=Electrophorus electricus TaxID=8005 RepID=A0A4W4EKE7_ELEEL